MLRRLVSAPITVVLLPVRLGRGLSSMRFSTVLAIGTGAAAAFTAARRLMDRDDAAEELPAALQQPAVKAQTSLRQWRGRLSDAMDEASEETATAAEELRQQYLRKTGRLQD